MCAGSSSMVLHGIHGMQADTKENITGDLITQ